MNWRKWNRWLHREMGYLFFGMAIIYGLSGIALNHGVARHWNPGIVSRSESFIYPESLSKSSVDRDIVEHLLEMTGQRSNYKQYYFPDDDHMMVYLKGGHIYVTLATGEVTLTRIRTRAVFSEVNYLHYNKPKKLWTWFSDLFALGLILMAVSGLIMVKGKRGVTGRNGFLLAAGIIIPLVFLTIYLWL
ncbi:MAG: PepSY-associated TM helix domain-containing protein [Bacteroidales bacterium]|nr:PepSY-associated TM helix domain-containing protein [Bacteroidales bacterium]